MLDRILRRWLPLGVLAALLPSSCLNFRVDDAPVAARGGAGGMATGMGGATARGGCGDCNAGAGEAMRPPESPGGEAGTEPGVGGRPPAAGGHAGAAARGGTTGAGGEVANSGAGRRAEAGNPGAGGPGEAGDGGAAAGAENAGGAAGAGAVGDEQFIDVSGAAVSNLLLKFWVTASGGLGVCFLAGDHCDGEMRLQQPEGVTFTAVAAAANLPLDRVDYIASDSDQRLYYSHSAGLHDYQWFGNWSILVDAHPLGTPDSLAIVAIAQTVHAFWLENNGQIGHAFGTNDLVAFERGDSSAKGYLTPLVPARSLNAVAPTTNGQAARIDLVLDGTAEHPIQHSWYDASVNNWGWAPDWNRELVAASGAPFTTPPRHFAVLSTSERTFELYAVGDDAGVWRTSFDAATGWSGNAGGTAVFEAFALTGTQPSWVLDACYFSNLRVLFGGYQGSDDTWQGLF